MVTLAKHNPPAWTDAEKRSIQRSPLSEYSRHMATKENYNLLGRWLKYT